MPNIDRSLQLPLPDSGRIEAERWVASHLAGLYCEGEVVSSPRFRGGQSAADLALERFDVAGYAATRNEAYPAKRRGASGLAPYIRHGLLSLPAVSEAVGAGPQEDVRKFRDELAWQEYARHWYARLGRATGMALRRDQAGPVAVDAPTTLEDGGQSPAGLPPNAMDLDMACLELTVGELEEEGYLVNQARMWLASHWSVRHGLDWRAGEQYFFRHLLDGSRAANRLGWQWSSGVGSNRAYGFSRWQVERRAPGLCAGCEVAATCPIYHWADDPELVPVEPNPLVGRDPDPDRTAGPAAVEIDHATDPAEAVWLTAESLGSADPALAANPQLPAVFVFDRPLLARLQLSSKRLVFLAETLGELALRRPVELYVGDPTDALADRPLSVTFAPVPGWRVRGDALTLAEVHPWPWLHRPDDGPIGSFSAWSKRFSPR